MRLLLRGLSHWEPKSQCSRTARKPTLTWRHFHRSNVKLRKLFWSEYFMVIIFDSMEVVRIFFIASGMGLSPLYCGHFWPIVLAPDVRWGWLWSNWWNEDWQGKPKYSEKTCPSSTLSTTNPTWSDPGLNPDGRGGKPATNLLSYGAAHK
jgi:hypothetical protein